MFFGLLFFTFEELVAIHFNCILDSAATLFTPETPKVFCGLKHFTPPPPVHQQSGAWIMSEFSFLDELFL